MASKPQLHSIDDFEQYASEYLPKAAKDYFNGGSLDGVTLRGNLDAFRSWYIKPRVLRDVSKLNTTTRVFPGGNEIPFPCTFRGIISYPGIPSLLTSSALGCVAPAAMQKMAHPDGEEATARGCGSFGVAMGLSSFSTTSLEEAKRQADGARKHAGLLGESECVLQMYLFENRSTSEDLIRRAESKLFLASRATFSFIMWWTCRFTTTSPTNVPRLTAV